MNNRVEDLRNNKDQVEKRNNIVSYLWHKFDKTVSLENSNFSDKNINEVFRNFFVITDLIPLMATVVDIPQVVRARPNYDGETFSD
ncbi:hypothetical protein [Pedobacter antarcticus]|uniref:hypothetical protein n=1 Tax=Pedobacter antarcticus TaxID=34086 RepID=UPI00088321D3|nr:hypothetical protein [Pedobacter antarcticus]SDM86848.1 hypothetical protein SAMN04488084_11639 [Pedobacter antarcticus]